MIEMLGTVDLKSIISCPVCGNEINEEMICTFCNRKFSVREGVYLMIDREISGLEWRWDKRILSQSYREEVMKGYNNLLSTRIREAHERWWDTTMPELNNLTGTVMDLGTGLGMMLERILNGTEAFAIATDIDPNVLLSTKRDFEKREYRNTLFVATDAKHLALRSSSVDHITSFAGINNITDPEEVMSELYRVLKPGGTAVVMASFVDEETPSSELAEDYGLLDAYLHDRFIEISENNGLEVVKDSEASSVVWEENEMDIFPIPGDNVYYHSMVLEK